MKSEIIFCNLLIQEGLVTPIIMSHSLSLLSHTSVHVERKNVTERFWIDTKH